MCSPPVPPHRNRHQRRPVQLPLIAGSVVLEISPLHATLHLTAVHERRPRFPQGACRWLCAHLDVCKLPGLATITLHRRSHSEPVGMKRGVAGSLAPAEVKLVQGQADRTRCVRLRTSEAVKLCGRLCLFRVELAVSQCRSGPRSGASNKVRPTPTMHHPQ